MTEPYSPQRRRVWLLERLVRGAHSPSSSWQPFPESQVDSGSQLDTFRPLYLMYEYL